MALKKTVKVKSSRLERDPEARFWLQVKSSNDGCWEFASHRPEPYPMLNVNGRSIGCHRFSYEIHFGQIPKGMFVCHRCDNPKCVRPDHLFLGTPKDNIRDAMAKKRLRYGSNNHAAKLTDSLVRLVFKLRTDGLLHKEIAEQLQITRGTVSNALSCKRWDHVGMEPMSGRLKTPPIPRHPFGKKLVESDIYEMYRMQSNGFMLKDIAVHFRINKVTVSNILRGKHWKAIHDEMKAKQK